jgi:proteasome lid subunit RPN8/RPN11
MNESTITISEELKARIDESATAAYPEECCGVLIGRENGESKQVIYILETDNIHSDNKTRRFMIGPDDVKRAERIAREKNAGIIGFYHSHPDHAAVPSEHDREFAWPWYIYIIVSVFNGKPSSVQGWRLRDDRSGYENIQINIS